MLGWDILHLLRCNIFRYVHSIYQKRLLVKSVYKLRCTDYLSKKNTITTSTPFQLIHLDLWGPYKIASICGAHYFLTIVDDFTRTTWTQLLQNKTQVGPVIKHFFSMMNTQFKAKIIMVRSDNGTEFLYSSCLDFFSENGIIHQKSIPSTPQQNGVAERKHRHLLDSTRAIRLLQEPLDFMRVCQNTFGENVSLQLHTLLTSFLWQTSIGQHLLKGCMASLQPMMT